MRSARHAELLPAPGGLAFVSSYDIDLIMRFKAAVPAGDRRWDPDAKRWLVSAQYGAQIAQIVFAQWGVTLQVPQIATAPQPETRMMKLDYLGQTKARGGDERIAYGFSNGDWSVSFPETALKRWFEVQDEPTDRPTLYGTLGIARTASADDVKGAYRRLARQWHPDVCKEANAAEAFRAIKRAYDILSEPNARARYDAGLALAATLRSELEPVIVTSGYRAPLRCGYLLCTGAESVGRFVVSQIIQWEDITDIAGRTMVSSWPVGADTFEVRWI